MVFGGQSQMLALIACRRLRVAVALTEAQAIADSRRPEPLASDEKQASAWAHGDGSHAGFLPTS